MMDIRFEAQSSRSEHALSIEQRDDLVSALWRWLDDCFGQFLVRASCRCGTSRHIEARGPGAWCAGRGLIKCAQAIELVRNGEVAERLMCSHVKSWRPF